MKHLSHLIYVAILSFFSFGLNGQNDCSIFKGIPLYNESISDSYEKKDELFHQTISKVVDKSYGEAKSHSANVGLELDDLLADFGYSQNSSGWSAFSSAFNKETLNRTSSLNKQTIISRHIDQGLVDAMRNCVLGGFGLNAVFSLSVTNSHKVYVKYNATRPTDTANIIIRYDIDGVLQPEIRRTISSGIMAVVISLAPLPLNSCINVSIESDVAGAASQASNLANFCNKKDPSEYHVTVERGPRGKGTGRMLLVLFDAKGDSISNWVWHGVDVMPKLVNVYQFHDEKNPSKRIGEIVRATIKMRPPTKHTPSLESVEVKRVSLTSLSHGTKFYRITLPPSLKADGTLGEGRLIGTGKATMDTTYPVEKL